MTFAFLPGAIPAAEALAPLLATLATGLAIMLAEGTSAPPALEDPAAEAILLAYGWA